MNKLTIKEVAQRVENEGLGYTIQNYMSGKHIEDEKLSKLWDECQELMDKIEQILYPYFTE